MIAGLHSLLTDPNVSGSQILPLLEALSPALSCLYERISGLEAMHCAPMQKVQAQEDRGLHCHARGNQRKPTCYLVRLLRTPSSQPQWRLGKLSRSGDDRRLGVAYCQRQLGCMSYFLFFFYQEVYCNSGGSWKKGNGYGNIKHPSCQHIINLSEIWKPGKG